MGRYSSLRPKGFFEITPLEGRKREGETLQCCHCGGIVFLNPGSGKTRGFCMNCSKITCGKPECDRCVPTERLLESIERGVSVDQMPVSVSVSRAPPREKVSPGGIVLGVG